MCRSDLLLLDEPTNHLDLDAVIWLQDWLREYPGTLLVISHDREFLDAVTTHTVHLEGTRATLYTGNYSQFERIRAEKMALQTATHAKQQRQVAHLQKFINRFKAQATKATQAQSRIKQLERMELVAPAHADSEFSFEFPTPERLPSPLVRFDEVDAGYADKAILRKLRVLVAPGERIGLLGPNGAGNPTYSPEFSAFSNLSGTGATITTHSAYAVLDITNPEQPPVLLAEITGATPLAGGSYGFTTVNPAGIAMSALNNTVTSPGAGNTDHWYFVFGNGPDSIATGGTASNARLVVYPLVLGSMSSTSGVAKDTGIGQSVMGDPITVDWNLDFLADNLYFGISNGSNATPSGKLFKETVSASQPASPSQWTAPTVLTDPGLPILEAPSAALDTGGNKWIYAGSGRLFVPADKSSVEQQTLFGVIDGTTLPTYGNLTDVSSGRVKVTPDSSGNNITGVTGATTESALESKVLSNHGWKTLLRVPAATDTASGSERVLTASAVLGGTLFATAYTPNNSLCLGNGNSRLFGVNFITGLANPVTPALGVNSTDTTVYNNFIDLGAGLAAAPSLHVNNTTSNNGSVTVITQTSTGSIVTTGAQVSPSLNNAEVDWRQTHPGSGP